MKLPIIINEHGDISFYRSLKKASSAVEAVDVKNNEYIAYDGEGKLLEFELQTKENPGVLGIGKITTEIVMIKEHPDKNDSQEELEQSLISFFRRASNIHEKEFTSTSLEQLINKAILLYGYAD